MLNKDLKSVLRSPFNFNEKREELLDNGDFILKYCLLEKAVYELGYELNSRPRWALIKKNSSRFYLGVTVEMSSPKRGSK